MLKPSLPISADDLRAALERTYTHEKLIKLIQEKTKTSVQQTFDLLGGVVHRKDFQACFATEVWGAPPIDLDGQKELADYITKALSAETLCEIFERARAIPAVGLIDYRQFDWDASPKDALKRSMVDFVAALKKAPGGSIAVVSPTILTILHMVEEFVHAVDIGSGIVAKVGTIGDAVIIVDHRANDAARAFIAAPQWLEYSNMDGLVIPTTYDIDDVTKDRVQKFASEMFYKINSGKVKVFDIIGRLIYF